MNITIRSAGSGKSFGRRVEAPVIGIIASQTSPPWMRCVSRWSVAWNWAAWFYRKQNQSQNFPASNATGAFFQKIRSASFQRLLAGTAKRQRTGGYRVSIPVPAKWGGAPAGLTRDNQNFRKNMLQPAGRLLRCAPAFAKIGGGNLTTINRQSFFVWLNALEFASRLMTSGS